VARICHRGWIPYEHMFDRLMTEDMATWFGAADRRHTELAWELAGSGREAQPDSSMSPEVGGLEPGMVLAATLSAVELEALSGHDRVTALAAYQRMASHYQAQVYAAMASVADAVSEVMEGDGEADMELVEAACASEIRAALRLTRRAADSELAVARDFQTRLPEVWQALATGRIDRRRANLIVHRTDHLAADQARLVAGQALERAPELTTGQLTALLRRLAVEADPADAVVRYESAVDGRRVVLDAGVDGTAHLYLMDLPPDRAARIRHRLDIAARSLKTAGEMRTMDQLRADVVLDLLDPTDDGRSQGPGRHGKARGSVVLTVDLSTLAGLAESAGDLGGYGPVIADIARQVTGDSVGGEWRFAVTDSESRPIHSGVTRRRPTAADRRTVETMYPRCVFPGCRVPSSQCDLDHTTPWAVGGETSVQNTAPVCRRDHVVRHLAGWTYRRTELGDHEWLSPLGHRYTNKARSP